MSKEMVLPVMVLPVGVKGVNSVCALFDQKALSSHTPSTASIRLPLTVVRELPDRCTPADAPTITLHAHTFVRLVSYRVQCSFPARVQVHSCKFCSFAKE